MAKNYLLNPELPYYKANLHGHTVLSDGRTTPDEYAALYKAAGYSVIATTDHEQYRYHRHLTTGDFVCLAGVELELYAPPVGDKLIDREKQCYHLNLYDTAPGARPKGYAPPPLDMDYHDTEALNDWIARLSGDGFLVCYNHPTWSMQTFRYYAGLKGLWGMEVYNHGSEVDGMIGYAPAVYDEMLRAGQRLCCVAADDNHNIYPLDSKLGACFGGFVMLNLPALSYERVTEGMRSGALYASTGPLIEELSLDGTALRVKTSPAYRVAALTESRRCFMEIAAPGSSITEAAFELTGTEQYVRVQVQDYGGKYAFTRAYYKDELGF